jgi:hypothetical protein
MFRSDAPPKPSRGELSRACNETILATQRSWSETKLCSYRPDQTTGCDHADDHSQLDLSRIDPGLSFRREGHRRLTEVKDGEIAAHRFL